MTGAPSVVVVGAGPAGIRAAQTLVEAGLRPVVVDEGARAGGQIYRRPPEGFTRPPATLYGPQARQAGELHRAFDAMAREGRLVHRPRSSVLALTEGRVQTLDERGVGWIACDALILATGASDRLAPVPGWECAGVYTLGAMQIALKAQAVALGRAIVLAGSGPLLTLVATQLLKAGAGLAAVLDTSPLRTQASALPDLAARPMFALRGMAMRARLGRLYKAGVALERIETDERGPLALHWRDARGRPRRTPCDAVGLGWHLRAETHLADLAGCAFDYDETWRQWLPRADSVGRARGGLYLAGDGFRPLGADAAEISGRLAAGACLADLGLQAPDPGADLRRLKPLTRFARGLARAFPWPQDAVRALRDEAIVCRCENVSAGELRAVAAYGGAEANRAKSLARVGMGRCQGRYCQLAGAEIIAAAANFDDVGRVGRLRGQPPARPAPVAAMLETEP